jgi:hypothetical protein
MKEGATKDYMYLRTIKPASRIGMLLVKCVNGLKLCLGDAFADDLLPHYLQLCVCVLWVS